MRANRLWMGLLLIVLAVGCGGAEPGEGEPSDELGMGIAQTAEELSSNALSKKQATTVLELVDDICGDTWCEGDHNFHFDAIQCKAACGASHAGSCQLTFRIFPHDSDLQAGPSYVRTCKTRGFTGFSSLVDTAASGYQSLQWEYYDALSACISELESKLPQT